MDGVRPHEHRLHEPADEGAGGPHHQPQEAFQARAQPSHQQVRYSVTISWEQQVLSLCNRFNSW